jgi:hypothetical protein
MRPLARLRGVSHSAIQRAIIRARNRRDVEQAEQKAAARAQRAADAIIRRQPTPPPYAPTGRIGGRIVSTDGLSRVLDEHDLWAEERARRMEARGTGAGIYMGDDEFAAWRTQSPHAARDRRLRDV